MKLIICALYCEAKPLIKKLQLKPLEFFPSFQVFGNKEYSLIISGTGKVNAAAATSFLLSKFEEVSVIVNIGVCGAKNKNIGDLFLVDQIIDDDSGRSFYPDPSCHFPLLDSGLRRNDEKMDSLDRLTLRTVSQPDSKQSFDELVDMESSGFFESAGKFLKVDQIQVLKIVSDNLDTEKLDPKNVEKIIESKLSEVLEFMDSFSLEKSVKGFSKDELRLIDDFMNDYHFTVTQERELKQLLWSACIQKERNLVEVLELVKIPLEEVDNKKEKGREVLTELKGFMTV